MSYRFTTGPTLGVSCTNGVIQPNTHGAPPPPLIADIALRSRARLCDRSLMVMEAMACLQNGRRRVAGSQRKLRYDVQGLCQCAADRCAFLCVLAGCGIERTRACVRRARARRDVGGRPT